MALQQRLASPSFPAAAVWSWLQTLAEHASGLVYVKDRESRHLLVNRHYERALGLSRDGILGRTDGELFPPDVAATISESDGLVFASESTHERVEVVPYGGVARRFVSLKVPLRDAEGRVWGLCGLATEMTDERPATHAFPPQNALTERLIESSSDGILAVDTEFRYTVWNPEMERISGFSAEQVLGRCAFDIFPFLLETGVDRLLREALAGGSVASREGVYTIPETGRAGVFEARYSPVHDARGRIIGALSVVRDVTERRRVEQERLELARAEAARTEAEAAVERLGFLARAGEALSSSLDYEQTLRAVAQLAVPVLGDFCIVDVLEDGRIRHVAAAHLVPAKVAQLAEARHLYPPSEPSHPAARVLRTGRPEVLTELAPERTAAWSPDGHHSDLVRALGVRSLLVVPLIARGAVFGVLSLGITESVRRYGGADLALAEELARRAALAVDNARLYRAAQEELAERRRAQEALRISEGRFRAIMEQSPLSTQILASDGTTLRVNRAWEELWGVTLDRIPEYNILADHQLEARGVAPLLRRAFAGEAVEIPATRYHPDETLPARTSHVDPVRWVRAFAYPVKDAEGTVREVVLVHQDVTKLRSAEEATRVLADASETLGASLDTNATLQNLTRVVVPRLADWCAVDLLTETGALERVAVNHPDPARVALASRLFERYPPRRLPGLGAWHVLETGTCSHVEVIDEAWLRAVAEDEEHLKLLRELGLRSYVCVPLVARDVAIGVLTLVHAESGRRYTVEDVALAKDLARRAAVAVENARLYGRLRIEDRRKDEFLATLAHELRNPLAPLRSGLEILRVGRPGPSMEKTREVMERQLGHMVRLVDDLLDLSRVTRGKVELHVQHVDLASLLATALEASRPLLDAAGVNLVVRLPDEPIVLDGDRTRLAQVLSNLLNNAAKYTEIGGQVTVSGYRDGPDVFVRVEDTGVGIPREMLTHVFEMFAQVGGSLDRSQGGLGIGLTLVKRLVELHGGRVWAESEGLGRGSAFVVRLPAAPGEGRSASAPPLVSPSAATRPRRVLVVDDNADAARLLGMLLELEGHEVRTASSGPAAFASIQGWCPDIAFLDIGMPGMSGYELARRLRSEARFAGLTLVAITGWGQPEDRRQSKEAGFDHHLTKPVEPAILSGLIQRHSLR